MNDYLERCETCGEIVDVEEIRYDAETDTTWCLSPTCGQ